MTVPRVLISGIGKRNHLLHLLAHECAVNHVELIGCDASPLAPARDELLRFEQLPFAGDHVFGQRYSQLLVQYEVAAYLTLIDPEITILGELASQGTLGEALFLHPFAETARVCEDKFAFYERMEAHGIPTVPTFLSPPQTYPHIRKDRRGSRSSGFRVFHSPIDSRSSGDAESDAEYIYQPFCAGQHYCVDAYFSVHSGALVDFCVKEVLNKQDGESYLLRSVSRARFIDLLRQVGQELPLRGIVNLDVYDDGNGVTLMEINCRIGGNYPASHAVGANLLRHLMREVVDGIAVSEAFSEYAVGMFVSKFIGFSDPYRRL